MQSGSSRLGPRNVNFAEQMDLFFAAWVSPAHYPRLDEFVGASVLKSINRGFAQVRQKVRADVILAKKLNERSDARSSAGHELAEASRACRHIPGVSRYQHSNLIFVACEHQGCFRAGQACRRSFGGS